MTTDHYMIVDHLSVDDDRPGPPFVRRSLADGDRLAADDRTRNANLDRRTLRDARLGRPCGFDDGRQYRGRSDRIRPLGGLDSSRIRRHRTLRRASKNPSTEPSRRCRGPASTGPSTRTDASSSCSRGRPTSTDSPVVSRRWPTTNRRLHTSRDAARRRLERHSREDVARQLALERDELVESIVDQVTSTLRNGGAYDGEIQSATNRFRPAGRLVFRRRERSVRSRTRGCLVAIYRTDGLGRRAPAARSGNRPRWTVSRGLDATDDRSVGRRRNAVRRV